MHRFPIGYADTPGARVKKDWCLQIDTHFYGTTCKGSISITACGSQLYDPLHGFSVLIRIENCNALETVMNHGVSKTNLTYLDQEKEMIGFRISVSE
jgi:hypothetical protein